MGEVFLARDTRLNRPVAIKVLSEALSSAAAARRFQREATTASALNHAQIVNVHEAGEIDGLQVLVTEFVDGGTLAGWATGRQRSDHSGILGAAHSPALESKRRPLGDV